VDNVLSLLALGLFIVAMIALSAGVTWGVVKLLPFKEKPKPVPTTTESS
jgi:hypothetical protein